MWMSRREVVRVLILDMVPLFHERSFRATIVVRLRLRDLECRSINRGQICIKWTFLAICLVGLRVTFRWCRVSDLGVDNLLCELAELAYVDHCYLLSHHGPRLPILHHVTFALVRQSELHGKDTERQLRFIIIDASLRQLCRACFDWLNHRRSSWWSFNERTLSLLLRCLADALKSVRT